MTDAPADPPQSPDLPTGLSGADLARDALQQARLRTAAKRAAIGRESVLGRRGGGLRRRWSGAGPDARDPKPFGALAQQWVKKSGSPDDLAKATVIARWSQIVGDDLASHCVPISLIDGRLTVEAESTAWATQIRMLSTIILDKIAGAVGPNMVRQIRAHGPTAPSWRFGLRHVSGRGPRDTYG